MGNAGFISSTVGLWRSSDARNSELSGFNSSSVLKAWVLASKLREVSLGKSESREDALGFNYPLLAHDTVSV